MEQLQQVIEFLKKWRFWICVGLAALMAMLVQYLGTPNVVAEVERQKGTLNNAYQNISRFLGGNHPNPKWMEEVKKRETDASTKVAEIQAKVFGEQAKLMTWPEKVAAEFDKRPFNAPLDDQRGNLLFFYFQSFDDQFAKLRKTVDPLEVTDEGEVIGKVVLEENALDRPKWTAQPSSRDAWIAQEQVWIQKAILQSIARINASAKTWYDASVREVIRISIGMDGIDIKRAAESGGRDTTSNVTLLEMPVPGAPPSGGAGNPGTGGDEGLNRLRYLQMGPDFREVPIQVRILGDQRRLPEILAGLAATDFGFVINEVSWMLPQSKVEVPKEIQEYSDTIPGSARDVIDNTIEITVWGDMRIYEMPAAQKQKYEEERLKAQQPAQPTPPQ